MRLPLFVVAAISSTVHAQQPPGNWEVYGRDAGGTRFSPLTQITRKNVARLNPAWTFHTGEAEVNTGRGRPPALETTPLVVFGKMYVSTPVGRVYALDAATGMVKWRYDANVDPTKGYGDFASRGVAFWRVPSGNLDAKCAQRIFAGSIDARLTALDAATGEKCTDFGDHGTIDLRPGLRIPPFEFQAYELTSPPTVVGDLIITGSAIGDNSRPNTASGEVRAWDARTGALRWTWDPIPQDPSDPVFRTGWRDTSAATTGAANVWSVIVADPARDLIFLPTSSPAPDYYGGLRLGDNRYGNSIVALRASTGKVVWHFQTVHHDLWDYDNASPPLLATVQGQPAVLQATKSGMLFVLNRETGTPIFPVREIPVPRSDIPGEEAWPTQPHGLQISPAPARVPAVWGPTEKDSLWCQAWIDALRHEPSIFVPPSTRGTFVLPSNIGGAHWGGMAADERRGIAVVPVNTVAAMVQLISTVGMNRDSLRKDDAARGISDFEYTRMNGTPYMMRRRIILGPSGLPCTPPPFGLLVGINLRNATIAWRAPLGTMGPPSGARQTAPPELGSPNLGGPIVTASGLVFIGATLDRVFRAFDVETGRVLWRANLPAGARATPMTYEVNGRQYVAISAGGGGPFGAGDAIIAYALPGRFLGRAVQRGNGPKQ
jgi:quinoprotein glucose dehydrogenase